MKVNNHTYKLEAVPKKPTDSVITFTVPPGIRMALDKLAEDQERSLSFLVRKAVEKDLREKGYLGTDDERTDSNKRK